MNIWSKHIFATRETCKYSWGVGIRPAKSVILKDGARLSIQASKTHYSQPREDNPWGGWERFEVLPLDGLLKADLAALYGDRISDWTDKGWPAGWVDASVLDAIAERHGGIA